MQKGICLGKRASVSNQIAKQLKMSETEGKQISPEIPDNAQDLTIFVQNLLEQMVGVYVFCCCILIVLHCLATKI